MVGHDFSYFVPHMLDAYLHYKVNGLSIQWYTPSFGGGLPAYPNPQHMQFTLPVLLMAFLDPWEAILASNVIFILSGFLSAYYLLKTIMGFDSFASALGAIIFNINGFVFSHAIVGHLGYQAFPLFPLLLIGLFHPKSKPLYKGILIALILSLNIHGGGFYVIVIYSLSGMIAIPILILLGPQIFNWKDFSKTILLSAIITMMLSSSKIFAVTAYMQWFSREIADQYEAGLLPGLYRLYLQLFGMTIRITYESLASTANMARNIKLGILSRSETYGLWEFDMGISPAALLILASLPFVYFFGKKNGTFPARSIPLAILSILGLWITLEFRFTNGLIYPYIHQLPVIKSLHVNLRYTAALLFPISLLATIGFNKLADRLKSDRQAFALFLILVLLTLFPLQTYRNVPTDVYRYSFNISQAKIDYDKIRSNKIFPISTLRDDIRDYDTFQKKASSLRPYEPIFGYHLEEFTPLTHPGPVSEITDGYFNITNPASLVFPKENNLTLFERIKSSEKDKFKEFINHKQPDWKRPPIQHLLDGLMVLTSILIILGIVYGAIKKGVRL